METYLSDENVVARKRYHCDACREWLESGYNRLDLKTAEQALILDAAEADRFRILTGQAYRKAVIVDSGEFFTYRARIGMDSLVNDLLRSDE